MSGFINTTTFCRNNLLTHFMFNKEGSFVVKKSEYDIRGQYRDACIVKALYAEKILKMKQIY